MRWGFFALVVVGLLVSTGGPAGALTITLNGGVGNDSSSVNVYANDGVGGYFEDSRYLTELPYSGVISTTDGGASAIAGYDLSGAGFDITWDLVRTGTYGNTVGATGSIHFSVDEDVYYTVSGSHAAVDPDGRNIDLYVEMHDYEAKEDILYNWQTSDVTPNESFIFGGSEGDAGNINIGSLTGTLIAGQEYWLYCFASLSITRSAAPSGASATGFISLDFTPVPEPDTALLLGLGLMGLAVRQRGSS